jgi:hypothetical protein
MVIMFLIAWQENCAMIVVSSIFCKSTMATAKQDLGAWGEELVAKCCHCPKCKKSGTFKRLPTNFKCADLICDFCGFLAQVKAMNVRVLEPLPKQVLGAAWGPQKDRMDSAIYFPLYLVLKAPAGQAIYYLPTDFQASKLFVPRKPLSENAKRAGWQGFIYDLTAIQHGALIQLL